MLFFYPLVLFSLTLLPPVFFPFMAIRSSPSPKIGCPNDLLSILAEDFFLVFSFFFRTCLSEMLPP